MSELIVNNQSLRFEQLRKLNPDQTLTGAQAKTSANSLDEVYLKLQGETYVAAGEQLNLSLLKGQSQVQVRLGSDPEPVNATLLAINDEIGSFNEGWAKGQSLGQSLELAWKGLSASPNWRSLHAISENVVKLPQSILAAPAPVVVPKPVVTQTFPPVTAPVKTPTHTKPTAPSSPDDKPLITAYFSQVYSGDVRQAQQSPDNPDVQLAKFINTARETLDIAAFEIDSEIIANAILKAKNENQVKVRVVTDSDYMHEPQLKRLIDAGIEVVDDQRSGLMHNKFAVVDGKAVWTGSFNFTDNCAWKNNNNALKIESKELAENFTQEFEEMFVGKAFGKTSPQGVPHPSVTVGKSTIETHFAAEGGVAGRVAEALNNAQSSIKFMAFSFTHDGIASAVVNRFNKGVTVQGVFEKTGSSTVHSEYTQMKQAGLDVRQDGNKSVMHHKVFIIDSKTVITGSFNFSDSADNKNDENLLIIEDPELAKQYEEEFKRVYGQGK